MLVAENSNRVLFRTGDAVWTLDIQTGDYQPMCSGHCFALQLHPNGRWLSYTHGRYQSDQLKVYVYDLQTNEEFLIYEDEVEDSDFPLVRPFWIIDTSILGFNIPATDGSDNQEMIFYNFDTREIVRRQPLTTPFGEVFDISPDGRYYLTAISPETWDFPLHDSNLFALSIHEYDVEGALLLPSAPYPEGYEFAAARLDDWHPNSNSALVLEIWLVDDQTPYRYDLNLYNLQTGDHRTLSTSNSYFYSVIPHRRTLIMTAHV